MGNATETIMLGNRGVSLIEVVIVVAIVGMLATMGLVSYRHFIEKGQAAEASVALAEVSRLEELYRQEHGAYTDDFALLRFSLPLQHYRIQVQLQNKGTGFQASALPLTAAQGASIQVVSSPVLSDPGGMAQHTGTDTDNPSPNYAQAPLTCEAGGEATVLSDGALDMNFCYQPPLTPRR